METGQPHLLLRGKVKASALAPSLSRRQGEARLGGMP